MEQSIEPESLWKALVSGGEASSSAIAKLSSMPEIKHEAALRHLFRHASGLVDTLCVNETKYPASFREGKNEILTVLDAVPLLANTSALRNLATEQLNGLDSHSRKLTNDEISVRCESAVERLRVPGEAELWAALVAGGDICNKALAELNKLPLPGRRAAFEVAIAGVLKKMETLITYLGTNPPPQDFQSEKQKLINVLDVIPSVATTLNFQLAALEQVARVADLSERLIDLDLGVKSVAAKEQIGSLLMEGITLPSLILLTAIPKKPQQ